MTGRPDDRYEVAARLEGRRGRGGRVVAVLAAIGILAWASVSLSSRLPAGPSVSATSRVHPAASGPAQDGSAAIAGDLPGVSPPLPPPVELLHPEAALGPVPVVFGGLGWLNPAHGTLDPGPSQDVWQWPFALPDGAACVCLETSVTGPATLHAYRFDEAGSLTSDTAVGDWQPADQVHGLEDAVLSPDGRSAVVGSATTTQTGGWILRLQRMPFDRGGGPAVSDESELRTDLASIADPARLELRLAGAPDGSRYRLSVVEVGDNLQLLPGSERSWLIPVRSGRFGQFADVAQPAAASGQAMCPDQGWATASIFVELCRSPDIDAGGQQRLFVRLERSTGGPTAVREVDLGPIEPKDVVGWLIDGSRGVVYGWAAIRNELYEVDVASGAVRQRALRQDSQSRYADDPIPGAGPDTAIGLLGPAAPTTRWQPTSRASQATGSPLVGSPDGRLLYATGLTGPGGDSRGVWVFDTRSLDVLAQWPALAAYQSVGLTSDGRYLIGIGGPGAAEIERSGRHGSELVLHDVADGAPIVILRQLELRLGGAPSLLPAGPPLARAPGSG